MGATVEYFTDAKGGYRFRVKGGNGEVMATSEAYTRRADAVRGYRDLASGILSHTDLEEHTVPRTAEPPAEQA